MIKPLGLVLADMMRSLSIDEAHHCSRFDELGLRARQYDEPQVLMAVLPQLHRVLQARQA
jgi:hypothetical protein